VCKPATLASAAADKEWAAERYRNGTLQPFPVATGAALGGACIKYKAWSKAEGFSSMRYTYVSADAWSGCSLLHISVGTGSMPVAHRSGRIQLPVFYPGVRCTSTNAGPPA
jgi:hypothetical protein